MDVPPCFLTLLLPVPGLPLFLSLLPFHEPRYLHRRGMEMSESESLRPSFILRGGILISSP